MAGDFLENEDKLRELIVQNRFNTSSTKVLIGSPLKFGINPLPFDLENSDSVFLNPDLQRSTFGTPIFSNLILGDPDNESNNTYTDFDGNLINYPTLRIDTVMFVVNLSKNIIKTATQGRNGTIKEYVSDGAFEIAATEEARKKGLMHKKKLNKNSGMLFVYPNKSYLSFYMKNTFIPLDIAFIDEQFRIVDIQQMEPLDETSIVSKKKAQFALEVNKGFFERVGLKVGDKLEVITAIPFISEE